jgi:hypothetical protein
MQTNKIPPAAIGQGVFRKQDAIAITGHPFSQEFTGVG